MGEWRALAPAGLERTEVAAARIGRSIFVVGGFEKRTGLTTRVLERYDIRTNRWRRLRPMPIGVNHGVATAYRGRLYVHGGYTARRDLTSATRRLYVYNPRTNRWRRLADSRQPRAAHAFAALRGKLYAAGGRNETADLTSMEVYDIARRRWRRGPSFPGPRRDHMTGAAAGGRFYALGGREGSTLYATAERFDPRRRRWQRLPAMRRKRPGSPRRWSAEDASWCSAARTSAPAARSSRWSCSIPARAAGAGCPTCARRATGWAAPR